MTVAHVVERAGVSRRTFYELFSDCEDCFLAAFEWALAEASERALAAYETENGWRERIRAGLAALLCLFYEQPMIARFLIVESQSAGVATQTRRAEIVAALRGAIEQGRSQAKAGTVIAPLTGECVVGGVLTVIHSRITGEGNKSLVQLTNPLMSMIVLPYMGAAAARNELDRPTPATPGKPQVEPPGNDPFKEAGIRLTYRTVRVLTAVVDHPGASNRLVADTAQINDQGQVSKLLTRLERAGMIANTGYGPGTGAPNSWDLTPSGRRVLATIVAHTKGRWRGGEAG